MRRCAENDTSFARRAGMALLATLWLASAAAAPHASETPPGAPYDEKQALATSQAAVGKRIGAHRLIDTEGRVVALEELRGKPLVISLIYTSCFHICPTITQNVANGVRVARDALGADSFRVVTIGFDVGVDTPAQLRRFAREQGVGDASWRFLAVDAATLEALARELGFVYYKSPRGYDHLTQTTVIDEHGVVYRQVYGEAFPVPALVEPLKELVYGRRANASSWDGWLNGVKLFCTVYDPASGRYKFDYSLIVAIGTGVLSFGAFGIFLVRAWRQQARARGRRAA